MRSGQLRFKPRRRPYPLQPRWCPSLASPESRAPSSPAFPYPLLVLLCHETMMPIPAQHGHEPRLYQLIAQTVAQ